MNRDRGHKKWTALMLSEHKSELRRLAATQADRSMPELEQDELSEFDTLIAECQYERCAVQLTYYERERRKMRSVKGRIHDCDPSARALVLTDRSEQRIRIPLSAICAVRRF